MRFFIVDAFTDRAFTGNSAGVVLLDEPADPAWMQAVAAEMKHAETAFVVTTDGPKSLRWFTPEVEVALCGHATLATTHVLGGEQTYTTKSGELRAKAQDGWVELDFPSDPPKATDDDLSAILPGVEIEYVGRGVENLFAVLPDAETVKNLEPDLEQLKNTWTGRLLVTAKGNDTDYVSRFFGPGVGIDEDPVTGSAHCILSPYWSEQFQKTELVGHQASARGGIVRTRQDGDRVHLAGQAVTVLSGELHV
ncbi:PhzF family phenazine biosynthesis protein [Amycolatopsis sp. SID8362]|uniref:PhzF family phenazine biosynthesis protein n=1 Tax=Amycolatopsis sp. SID8362 TaxID=2690346 RepID=UPI0013711EC9|nr:PhzF family phenazine biosynthesis protein [Amycolatopsis sp. SID8362]NBH02388.1 PhzF family phenazine biosynthesis isomerase [Amycolatopsis sp. SID8362]NED39092.1 PhzF family phenazine biosynthesis protein [Amycolatopsis sp. SID8362]